MRLFTDVLRDYRNGRAVEMLTKDYNECVRAVDETGAPATLTITIKIEPEKGGGSQKELSIKRKSTLPKADIPKAVFFSDEDGNLHRSDPNQAEMFVDSSTRGRA